MTHLDFGDGPAETPSAEEQVILATQAQADEALEQELLGRQAQRRKARREKQGHLQPTAGSARKTARTETRPRPRNRKSGPERVQKLTPALIPTVYITELGWKTTESASQGSRTSCECDQLMVSKTAAQKKCWPRSPSSAPPTTPSRG